MEAGSVIKRIKIVGLQWREGNIPLSGQMKENRETEIMRICNRMKAGAAWCALALLLLTGCGTKEEDANTYQKINAKEAAAMMEEKTDYIILDVRTQEEYAEKHIPGAICIPNESIGTGEITELPDKEQLIFVYCRSGNRSKQASEKLVKLGYTNVMEFGGINDWNGDVVSGKEK